MSQLGVKDFVVQTLQTVTLADLVWGGRPLIFRQRPKQTKLGDNVVLTLGRCGYDEVRHTNPRTTTQPPTVTAGGAKKRAYTVDVLVYATWPDEQSGGDSFDVLVERVANALETASVPMYNWPDPVVPGVTSEIGEVGERARVQMVDPILTAGRDSRTRFGAIVTAYVTEYVQG